MIKRMKNFPRLGPFVFAALMTIAGCKKQNDPTQPAQQSFEPFVYTLGQHEPRYDSILKLLDQYNPIIIVANTDDSIADYRARYWGSTLWQNVNKKFDECVAYAGKNGHQIEFSGPLRVCVIDSTSFDYSSPLLMYADYPHIRLIDLQALAAKGFTFTFERMDNNSNKKNIPHYCYIGDEKTILFDDARARMAQQQKAQPNSTHADSIAHQKLARMRLVKPR